MIINYENKQYEIENVSASKFFGENKFKLRFTVIDTATSGRSECDISLINLNIASDEVAKYMVENCVFDVMIEKHLIKKINKEKEMQHVSAE